MNPNPLSAYFRQPSIYINLPSLGHWWSDGSLAMPVSNEISVMSMTAGDEILLKTPDALYSGEATVSMIHNCVPCIKNAWLMPIVDLETVLIAIRIASVGEILSIEATCPKCSESSNYDIDLRIQLNQFDVSQWHKTLPLDKMTVEFQPISYAQLTDFQNKLFQHQKQLKHLVNAEQTAEIEDSINKIITDINAIELESYCACIRSIQIDNLRVSEPEYISEFIINCEKKQFTKIKEHIDQLKNSAKCSDLNLMCNECNYQFVSSFSMDYTSFFELSS
jgi:hypothetical protein